METHRLKEIQTHWQKNAAVRPQAAAINVPSSLTQKDGRPLTSQHACILGERKRQHLLEIDTN
jgi:hypothetical protein